MKTNSERLKRIETKVQALQEDNQTEELLYIIESLIEAIQTIYPDTDKLKKELERLQHKLKKT